MNEPAIASRKVPAKELLLVGLILFTLAILLQWAGGAYRSEFGGHPDEAAHYVTGLMIRDYIANGFPGAPMKFAKEYYDHYPKVALGNWPPAFYLIQSAWSLVIPPSRTAMLLLMAALSAGVALVSYAFARNQIGKVGAVTVALLFLLIPLTQRHTAMIMTEIPIALFVLLALLSFGRFVETGRPRDSILFGVFASLAILTKGSGMFLALVPLLALIFAWKLSLLRKLSFWYAAVIVAVLCGPWTWKFRDVARAGWMESEPSLNFTKQAMLFYPQQLLLAVGAAIGVFAIIGIVWKLVIDRKGPGHGQWAALAAALISLPVFHSIVPAGLENRHLVPALPIVLLFAGAGIVGIATWLKRKGVSPQRVGGVLAVIAIGAFFGITFSIPQKGYGGFGPAAAIALEKAPDPKQVFLVSSDAQGEGMFIAEVAMQEKRPGHFVQRSSKALASSSWSGEGYQSKYKNEESMLEFLTKRNITFLVLDGSIPSYNKKEHHEILEKTAAKYTNTFSLEGKFDVQRKGISTNALLVYRLNSGSTN
jgi:hypothetical protein